jgi:hypothetical protein
MKIIAILMTKTKTNQVCETKIMMKQMITNFKLSYDVRVRERKGSESKLSFLPN